MRPGSVCRHLKIAGPAIISRFFHVASQQPRKVATHPHRAILQTMSVDTSDVFAYESRLAPRAASQKESKEQPNNKSSEDQSPSVGHPTSVVATWNQSNPSDESKNKPPSDWWASLDYS